MTIRIAAVLFAAFQLALVGVVTFIVSPELLAGGLALTGLSAAAWGLLLLVSVAVVAKAARGERRLQHVRPISEKPAVYDRASGGYVEWYLRHRLEEEIARASRYEQPFALLLIGPERGRFAANAAQVSTAVSSTFRDADLVVHLGGLRFAVLLTNTDAEGARLAGERLLVQLPVQDVRVGLSCFPEDGETWDALLTNAGATEDDMHIVAGEPPNPIPIRRAA